MEVPLTGGSPAPDSKDSYRSVKPPDQCVISYNFEHANSLNFTHNLLIGMGLDEPARKQHSSLAGPHKQKLFSIIPHPKKVFRNEPASVSRAYNAAVLPKRYVPTHPKLRSNPNYSEHLPGEQQERISNERSSHLPQERPLPAEESRPGGERESSQAEFNSPYGTLGKKKADKPNYSKNQKAQKELSTNISPMRVVSPKIQAASFSHEEEEQDESGLNEQANSNNFNSGSLIREVSEDKESQSNLQQNAPLLTNLDVEEGPHSKQNIIPLSQPPLHNQDNQEPSSSLSIRPEQSSKQVLPHSSISIEQSPESTAINAKNNPFQLSHEVMNQADLSSCSKQKLHANSKLMVQQEQKKVKSKKQIQDEQLQELQMRVRREESANFKKGYFRVSSNKQKQILPFQAGIEPLFTNKQSLAQNPNSSLPKNGSVNMGNRNSQLNHSKVDPRKVIQQVVRSSGLNSNSFSLTGPSNVTKPSRFISPTQNAAQPREKQNWKGNLSVKKQSNNLTAIATAQKIKRPTEDSTSKQKNIKTELAEKYKPVANEAAEDLTTNNQIKGFKVPQKVVSAKMPKISKAQSHLELLQRPSDFEAKKSNEKIQKKNTDDENQIQKNEAQSRSSFNKLNLLKKSSNITDRVADDKRSANNKSPNNKVPNSNKTTPNNKIISTNIKNANSKTPNKLPEQYDKQRYSQMGPNGKSKQNDADLVGDEKTLNPRSKQKQPAARANQSAFVGSTQKSSQIGRSERPIKPTATRQSKDKDYKLKKWRDAQLEEVERQRRQSKRRQQSNASRDKESKRSGSKMRPKRSQIIDLDAEEDDKFGLLSLRKSSSNSRTSKGLRQTKKMKEAKRINTQELQHLEQNKEPSQHGSNQEQQGVDEKLSEGSSKSAEESGEDEGLMDENQQQISSIHSSKITEQDEEPTEQPVSHRNRKSLSPRENLEELLIATEQSPSSNKLHDLPVDIQLENSNVIEPVTHQSAQQGLQPEKKQDPEMLASNPVEQKQIISEEKGDDQQSQHIEKQQILVEKPNEQVVARHPNGQEMIESPDYKDVSGETPIQNDPLLIKQSLAIDAVNPPESEAKEVDIEQQKNPSSKLRIGGPLANISNKQQDFFEYNIKQMSKFNETVNQTFNVTKYQTFDRDLSEYIRAPILSFIYGHAQTITNSINSFLPSAQRINLQEEGSLGEPSGEQIIDQAINILLSIDHWIIQRIFEPFLSKHGEIGVWLHWQGHWQIVQVGGDNFRIVLRNAIAKLSIEKSLQYGLEDVLRLISGVRVAKLKSSKKRVLSELDYSLNKKHVLKAVTAKNSKWGERMFEVVKVEVSKQGGNVLKLKERSQFFWVREEKFQQIFQHFLLICTRPSHFWTTSLIANKESHKSVLCLRSEAAVHGSVTLYYPSEQRSSLCFYKELQSKVLKFMGKIEEKANQNGNLYFQFRMHGTYYLFLQTPTDCELAIESTCKLGIGEPEYIVSQTLKNDKCEYVEIEHSRNTNRPASKQMETLEKLREKFINMVSTK